MAYSDVEPLCLKCDPGYLRVPHDIPRGSKQGCQLMATQDAHLPAAIPHTRNVDIKCTTKSQSFSVIPENLKIDALIFAEILEILAI